MNEIQCKDLEIEIESHRQSGFRLDMIKPADKPREALMSRGGSLVRLTLISLPTDEDRSCGRAGMEYSDLIPGRLDGRVIASHIRLTEGGEVPDYVHYHKIEFQMIYCSKGRIKVVYEDQGPPFWLETGDCVLQPPEIRHRVLECTAGAEVIEVSMPAEHETWVDHEIALPGDEVDRQRMFGGQRFVRSVAADAEWTRIPGENSEIRNTGIFGASGGVADVRVFRGSEMEEGARIGTGGSGKYGFQFPLGKGETLVVDLFPDR